MYSYMPNEHEKKPFSLFDLEYLFTKPLSSFSRKYLQVNILCEIRIQN